MAKKNSTANNAPATKPAAAAVSSTPVRNTAIPKPTRSEPSQAQVAIRAYEIFLSGNGGSQDDHWFRAERELRGGN